jgi:hypothetical protein
MKSLFKRSALASALLLTALGTQAESVSFETSDSDTVVVGATAEKVTLRVTGYKNLSPSAATATQIKIGSFTMSTSSGTGQLAVTYAPEHKPKNDGGWITGELKNESGDIVTTALYTSRPGYDNLAAMDINGEPWGVAATYKEQSYTGNIITFNNSALPVGVYPITLRAALYQQ